MKVKAISDNLIPEILDDDLDVMEYEIGGFVNVKLVAGLKEDKNKIIKIAISFCSLALKIADDFNYMGFGEEYLSEYPDFQTPEREVFMSNTLLEFIDTKYLRDFNRTNAELHVEKARHFCIRTRNEIVDFISESEPTVTVEYVDETEYNKQKNEETLEVSKSEFEEFQKWKSSQNEKIK